MKTARHTDAAEIHFNCPQCGGTIDADARRMGMRLPCPHCEQWLQVPVAETAPALVPQSVATRWPKVLLGTCLLLFFMLASMLAGVWLAPRLPRLTRQLADWMEAHWPLEQPAWEETDPRPGQDDRTIAIAEAPAPVPTPLPEEVAAPARTPPPAPQPSTAPPQDDPPAAPVRETEDLHEWQPPRSIEEMMQACLIVEGQRASGSAFLVHMGEGTFIMTNIHVVENNPGLVFRNMHGRRLVYGAHLYIARELDLALLPVRAEDALHALSFATDRPYMNQRVYVYGNSEGQRVLTSIDGQVLGIGPDHLEVSAAFVRGNSGGPILNEAGEVLAVVSHGTVPVAPDHTTEGSRFGRVRRFGLRPTTQPHDWVRTSFAEMDRIAGSLADAKEYIEDVQAILTCWNPTTEGFAERRRFEAAHTYRGLRVYHDTPWKQYLVNFADLYYRFWTDRFRSGNPRDLNPTLRNRRHAVEYSFTLLLSEMHKDVNAQYHVIARMGYYRRQLDALNKRIEQIEREISDVIKSSEWNLRCVVPSLIALQPQIKATDHKDFFYGDDVIRIMLE